MLKAIYLAGVSLFLIALLPFMKTAAAAVAPMAPTSEITGQGVVASPARDEGVRVARGGRPGAIRGGFNRAASGKPSARGAFNRATARPSAKRPFNRAARGPRALARTGARKSSIGRTAKLRAQYRMSARQMTRKGPAVFRSKMAGQFRASASQRVTPPRQVTSALGKGKWSTTPAARSNVSGGKPPGYLSKKFNANALGVRSIRGTFNRASGAGGGGGGGGGGAPQNTLKPTGPKF